MPEETAQAEAAVAPTAAEREAARVATARMLTYRLIPLWMFLATFGFTVVWEGAVRGNPLTSEKLQAIALLSLLFALLVGAPIGIRFFNPLPPKT
jgi:hypothetical protein